VTTEANSHLALPAAIPARARDRGKTAPLQFAHAAIQSSYDHASVRRNWVGLQVDPTPANTRIAFLTRDEEHHHFAIANVPAPLPRAGGFRTRLARGTGRSRRP
jgi:hypothetical protein